VVHRGNTTNPLTRAVAALAIEQSDFAMPG
jgi:hypothetical protein